MNRFLNKKKGGDEPPTPPQAAKKWRKGKKAPVLEQKPQLDLTAALPSTDDFRTSLIMPTLSTRFSMLREQDDPNTKMGKASDDSVLQPQRSSRLLDFGFSSNALNDIAEVASMKSSIRPPFASSEKHSSYASEEGYGTDGESNNNGNMMSRARPGEGNILFGGRQKVYKIATGSTKSLGGMGGGNMGKVVYEDDVNMSAFQRYRQQQQREAAAAAVANDEHLLEHETGSRESLASTHHSEDQSHVIGLGLTHSHSVTAHHDAQRLSSSTTTSVPSQGNTSTAATSVASQTIGTAVTTSTAQHSTVATSVSTASSPAPAPIAERSLSKRRLYEHGLEKNLYEQQASTLTRLNSLQRHRSPTVGSVGSAPSLHHSQSIGHLHERGFQPYALQTSSQPAGKSFPPLAVHKSPPGSHPQSPLSPTMSESEEYKTLHSALEPGDRGKATAMGAFNRPRQQYDEEQYMQRQVQLHQSNQSSMSRKNSVDVPNQSDSRLGRSDSARQTPDPRTRSASVSVSPKIEQSPSQPFSVFQNAAIQNRLIHGENPNLPPAAPLPPAPTVADTHRTFFGDISASEDEEEDEEDDIVSDFEQSTPQYVPNNFMTGSGNGRFTPTSLASVSEHPAVRHETPNIPEVDEEEEEEPIIPTAQLRMTTSDAKATTAAEPENPPPSSGGYKEVDSPTIGSKDGLSSLIYHLRKSSDQSSIYPPIAQSHHDMVDNAWDLDDLENYYGEAIGNRPSSQTGFTKAKGQPLGPAGSKANIYPSRPSTRDSDTIDGALWQNDFKKQHTRDASTATQAERQAFDEELAARQRAIQEKMRNLVENESRGTSPGPSAGGALKAFGMLKSKASQETISRDGSSKALKKLGLGAQNGQQGKSATYEEPSVNAWVPTSNPQWPLPGPKEQKTMASPPVQQGQTMQPMQAVQRSPPQHPKTRDGPRSRSNSSAFRSRSRSRTNVYRDDFGGPPDMPQLLSARPSMETMHSITPPSLTEQVRGRLRSNSKQASYFDHEPPHHGFMGTPSGRMTPGGISPGSALTTTQTASSNAAPRPSYTTPSSSYGSKNGSGPSAAHVPTTVRPAGSLLRKKTINKADIGEPTLISSTSNVDTVDLPTARTLVQPPLLPILNPRRRVYTHGDATMSAGEVGRNAFSPPPMQHAATYSGGPGPRMSMRSPSVRQSVEDLSSQFDAVGSPMMNEAGMF